MVVWLLCSTVFTMGHCRVLHKACAMTVVTLATVPTMGHRLVFHKACAKYFILVSVVGHATAHYVNYAKVAPCLL